MTSDNRECGVEEMLLPLADDAVPQQHVIILRLLSILTLFACAGKAEPLYPAFLTSTLCKHSAISRARAFAHEWNVRVKPWFVQVLCKFALCTVKDPDGSSRWFPRASIGVVYYIPPSNSEIPRALRKTEGLTTRLYILLDASETQLSLLKRASGEHAPSKHPQEV